jgi:hypothetical protein
MVTEQNVYVTFLAYVRILFLRLSEKKEATNIRSSRTEF